MEALIPGRRGGEITITGLINGRIGQGFLSGRSVEHVAEAIAAAIPGALEGHYDREYIVDGSDAQLNAHTAKLYVEALNKLQQPDLERSDIAYLQNNSLADTPYE